MFICSTIQSAKGKEQKKEREENCTGYYISYIILIFFLVFEMDQTKLKLIGMEKWGRELIDKTGEV